MSLKNVTLASVVAATMFIAGSGTVALASPVTSASAAHHNARSIPINDQAALAAGFAAFGQKMESLPTSVDGLSLNSAAVQALLKTTPTSRVVTPDFNPWAAVKCVADMANVALTVGTSVGEIKAALLELKELAGGWSLILNFLRYGDLGALSANAWKLLENASGIPALISTCSQVF